MHGFLAVLAVTLSAASADPYRCGEYLLSHGECDGLQTGKPRCIEALPSPILLLAGIHSQMTRTPRHAYALTSSSFHWKHQRELQSRMTTFDLNLLRLFEVVMRTGSATLAADELGLTQSAVSSSIRKLREHFADPLFVFSSAGMVLTPKAHRISSPILSALGHVKRATATHDFAPSATSRTFRISVSDFGQMLLLPALVKSLSQEAPGLVLETVDAPPREVARMMEQGDIDIAVGPLGPFGDGFHRQEVFADRYVCLVRREHPAIQGRISAQEYLQARHVIYKSRGEGTPGFEKELEALAYSHGLTQNVAMRLAYTLGLARLIARSDYITTVPSRLASLYEDYPGLAIIPLEFFVSRYVLSLQWHARVHRDPAHVWLRARVLGVLVPDRSPLSE